MQCVEYARRFLMITRCCPFLSHAASSPLEVKLPSRTMSLTPTARSVSFAGVDGAHDIWTEIDHVTSVACASQASVVRLVAQPCAHSSSRANVPFTLGFDCLVFLLCCEAARATLLKSFNLSRCHYLAQPCSETFPVAKYSNGKVAGEDAKPK